MLNQLKPIVAQKEREVALLRQGIKSEPNSLLAKAMRFELPVQKRGRFKEALCTPSLAVIAEIKRRSPSKGLIAPILDPSALAQRYVSGGANALSILTDKLFFNGDIADMVHVTQTLGKSTPPILRKEFIIDEVQIAEAAIHGANAILCIVSILGDKTKPFIDVAHALGLDVLVEVHHDDELMQALDSGAEIIGVNHRNLTTFAMDHKRSLSLISKIPNSIITVAESGISTPLQAQQYYQAGFDAVLIGEALVKSPCPEDFIKECRCG